MLKEISTYGALLLTAMVVIRATTMEVETEEEVRSLYERKADLPYIVSNLAQRTENEFYTPEKAVVLIAQARKNTTLLNSNNRLQKLTPDQPMRLDDPITTQLTTLVAADSDLPILTPISDVDADMGHLSLDRESTVNSGISLLFPRQRIQPKPAALDD